MEFGMLTFISVLPKNSADNHKMWVVECKCGTRFNAIATRVRNGFCKQCKNCRYKQVANSKKTHGARYTREYNIWSGIKMRCLNPLSKDYSRYGGAGIIICDKWKNNFDAFLKDVGPCPSVRHSIDRYPNNNGNYEPMNVRWATRSEQQRNKNCSVYVTDGSKIIHIRDVSRLLGISNGAAHLRLKRGKLNGYSRV